MPFTEGAGLSLTVAEIAAVLLVVLAVLVGLLFLAASRSRNRRTGPSAAPESVPDPRVRVRPTLVDFHVHGDTAGIYYRVPLPDGDIDERLEQLLCHDASLVLHEKRSRGLPIDHVVRAEVYGERGGGPAEIAVLELDEPGAIPALVAPDLVPHASVVGYDPLAHLDEQEFVVQPGVEGREPEGDLPPFSEEIEFAKATEAELRAAGIDPHAASLSDVSLSLLRIGGFSISPRTGGTYVAQKAGATTLIAIHEHREGEHPELSEQAVDAFVIAVAQSNPSRALLITDKYGPFVVYEKERSDPRCRFITRERLQQFFDSFALR